jgi:hypothetical protein
MPGFKPGHDVECVPPARLCISDSIFKQPHRHAYSFPRARAAPGFVQPSIKEGVERRKAPPRVPRLRSCELRRGALITRARRLPAPHLRLFCPRNRASGRATREAFGSPDPGGSRRPSSPAASSPLRAAGHSAGGRLAGASRCQGYKPRQQAPPPPRVRQCPAERPSRGVGLRTIGLL